MDSLPTDVLAEVLAPLLRLHEVACLRCVCAHAARALRFTPSHVVHHARGRLLWHRRGAPRRCVVATCPNTCLTRLVWEAPSHPTTPFVPYCEFHMDARVLNMLQIYCVKFSR